MCRLSEFKVFQCYSASYSFLLVPAVAVRAAGGKGILPHKVRHAARLAHGVQSKWHMAVPVIKPQLPHQRADAAFREAPS